MRIVSVAPQMPVRRSFAFFAMRRAMSRFAPRVHVRVADAFEMAHHRHARILLHARDEALAAARHDDVDEAAHVAQHDPDGLAILRRHHLHGRFGQAVHAERPSETGMDRGARARAFGAAAQDRGIAALQAKRGRVGRDVRPALVNDADHAERHAHARDLETVRTLPFGDGLPDGIVERRDRFEPGGRRFDPLVVERQPVDDRGRRAARFGLGDVLGVGGEHGGARVSQLARGRLEDFALDRGRRLGEDRRSRTRGAAELEHLFAQAVRHTVLRGAHDCFVPKSTKSSRWMISSPPL